MVALCANILGPDALRQRGDFLLLVQEKVTKEKDTPGTQASRWSAPLSVSLGYSPRRAAAQLASFAAQNKLEQVLAEIPRHGCVTRQCTWGPQLRLSAHVASSFDFRFSWRTWRLGGLGFFRVVCLNIAWGQVQA